MPIVIQRGTAATSARFPTVGDGQAGLYDGGTLGQDALVAEHTAGMWVGDPNEAGEVLGIAGELIQFGSIVCLDADGVVWKATYARAAAGYPPVSTCALGVLPGQAVRAPLRFYWARFFEHPRAFDTHAPVYLDPDRAGVATVTWRPGTATLWRLGRQGELWVDAEFGRIEWQVEEVEP